MEAERLLHPGALGVEVRPARADEYREAGRVTAEAYREFALRGHKGWQEYLKEIADVRHRVDRTLVLVAVERERVLGSATLELDGTIGDEGDLAPGEAHLRMLGVLPEARGRGAGRALVEACVERARRAGKHVLRLSTSPKMRSAHALYTSMGFVRDPGRDQETGDGLTLLAFRLPL